LRALKRKAKSPFIFVTERGAPFSVSGLAKLIERAGIEAKIPFKVHAHMLRHACGYAQANKGTDMHRLSELSRYDPEGLATYLAGKEN
jgi:site-specific recombinase XerD